MDACARIRGVPLRTRASIRKETVRDGGPQCVKSLLRNKKELCSVDLELQTRDATKLTEIHFVCLPGHCEGEDVTLQALSSLPGELCELLKSVHVHSLKNDEVLMLKDSRWLAERKDSSTQCWLKAICVLRHGPPPSSSSSSCGPQASVSSLVGLLGRYAAGVRYALELQALHRGGAAEPGPPEEDDTNQSVSSIEDDFVTALEHLEEEDAMTAAAPRYHGKKRDVASQTVPAHKRRKDLSGSRVIISSSSRKSSTKHPSRPGGGAEVSVTVQRSSGLESQWTHCNPGICNPQPSSSSTAATRRLSESEDSDGSSPSPIIFLDEVGYQKSLLAKLDIPQVPGGPRERVEDSDSEVSEFFDSFDQFDDDDEHPDELGGGALPLDLADPSAAQKKRPSETTSVSGSKYVSRGCSTKGMNPHRFDRPTLPANVKKPTPLKPGSPYSPHSDVSPDSPRPARSSREESGGPLFSPVSSSAFSPLRDGSGTLEYFWKTEGDGGGGELRKPQDLCSLYKTYSDFANSLSNEILASVCGYPSPVDISDNKNLSCVCHKEFQNPSGHLMKLQDIQETEATVAKLRRDNDSKPPQSLKDGIQRFATDLVAASLGGALRDLQRGVHTCTTTLCQLAARLTSSVFQMAFQEIGMRRALVLKERAIGGLAGFLAGEAVAAALKEFLAVRKRMFHGAVSGFAADLAEELVFEGIMEVCQFSHPSTPGLDAWPFGRRGLEEEEEEEEEVVTSYASDLSESVLQEAFIELSQADVAFTSRAAISVSLDNVCYVSSAEDTATRTSCSSAAASGGHGPQQQGFHTAEAAAAAIPGEEAEEGRTVKKALITVSGMASCVPVPQAGQALSHAQLDDTYTSQTSRPALETTASSSSSSSDMTAATQTDHTSSSHEATEAEREPPATTAASQAKNPFHNFSGNMVDMIVSEACELITATKVKKGFGECADFLAKTVGSRRGSGADADVPDSPRRNRATAATATLDHPVTIKDTLDVPAEAGGARRKSPAPPLLGGGGDSSPGSSSLKSSSGRTTPPGTPPSTPQQPQGVSQEKQIRRFSKKLKGKLAKEFSPATPPPTPHEGQPEAGGDNDQSKESAATTPEAAGEADFMLKLMRSLSEEAEGEEEEEEGEEEDNGDVATNKHWETTGGGVRQQGPELNLSTRRRTSNKEALHYAERLACHIVSMATEMEDTLGADGGDDERRRRRGVGGGSVVTTAQFSEQTLNTLWVYAGEVAGEVISDVKRMVAAGSQPCPHHHQHRRSLRAQRRSSLDGARSEMSLLYPRPRVGSLHPPVTPSSSSASSSSSSTSTASCSSSSGLSSSDYPSCESVTDEYAGYLIRVLKKEGGGRELVLDQYASRLAYRSIKLGLAHAARKIKQRPASANAAATRFRSSRSLPEEWKGSVPRDAVPLPGREGRRCSCRDSDKRSYGDLVSFAESLAYSITCDVTRKLHPSATSSTPRLPKSLTDSCLYKRSALEGMAENLIRNSFSCPLLLSSTSKESAKSGQTYYPHNTTGSLLRDTGVYGGSSSSAIRVIEHYARKIVDDTLEMSLMASAGQARERQRVRGGSGPDGYSSSSSSSHTDRLSDSGATLGDRTCRYCQSQECHYSRHQHQCRTTKAQESSLCGGAASGLEIPKIHIHNTDCGGGGGGGSGAAVTASSFAEEMVHAAMETAKRELSNTSLNADSGIGHDGASYAESLTTEIMASALSNACQAGASSSSPGREATESTMSQQLSVGDDSLGSWSNLSFEDEPPDDNSSFLHLSDSDCTEDKETEVREESSGTACAVDSRTQVQQLAPRALLVVVNSDVREHRSGSHDDPLLLPAVALDPQLRSMLQWAAASMVDLPRVQLSTGAELQQLPTVVRRLREREWRVGELLQALLRYCEENQRSNEDGSAEQLQPRGAPHPHQTPLFQWLLEHA